MSGVHEKTLAAGRGNRNVGGELPASIDAREVNFRLTATSKSAASWPGAKPDCVRPFFFTFADPVCPRCGGLSGRRQIGALLLPRTRSAATLQFSRGLLSRSASSQSHRIKASRPKPKAYPVHVERLSSLFGFNANRLKREASQINGKAFQRA